MKDSPFRWYNGNVTTLLHSLKAGSDGYGGVSANFYPWMHAWLCANFDKEPEKAVKVQRFLTVAEALVKTKYPASAKVRRTAESLAPRPPCMLWTAYPPPPPL